MKWISNAKVGYEHTQEELAKGSSFYVNIENLNISIHKYAGCGNDLFLNCDKLRINNRDLGTDNFDIAVEKSKEIIRKEFNELQKQVTIFLEDKEGNKLSKY